MSEFIPEKLSLRIGLPIIICTNAATELCITKSQEGTIYGWQAGIGSRNQQILDTLFVKLCNPPQSIQFEGLPENVVPLVRRSNKIDCFFPNDTSLHVSHSQVEVLPNFAMTDYDSQGKTHAYNISKSCELQVSSVAAQVCLGLHSQYTLSSVGFRCFHRPVQPTAAKNKVC